MKNTIIAAMAPLLLLTAGCGGLSVDCTEIGCGNAVTINLYMNTFEEADYRVEMLIDDEIAECVFSIDDAGQLEAMACDSTDLDISSYYQAATRQGEANRDPMPTPTLTIQVYRSDIEELDLRLLQDETETYQEDVSLSYFDVYPNGDDCPPACKVATVDAFI